MKKPIFRLFNRNRPKKTAEPRFLGQQVARRYCLTAVLFFGIQGLVALLGAIDLIIPDLPSPIPFEYGRSIHLSLAVLWPLIGTMGLVYFSVVKEMNSDIFSIKVATWQFYLVLIFSLSIYLTLAFKIGNGREYLGGLSFLYIGIFLSLLLGSYNLVRTLINKKRNLTSPAVIMAGGVIFLLVLLFPNIFSYRNPIADEAAKFFVVHLWEENAFEITSAGFIAFFLKENHLVNKETIEKWLYLDISLIVISGLFSTGHHYYWIGYPYFWLILGVVFSFLQIIPVGMLSYLIYKGIRSNSPISKREKLTLWLILSSLFYHILGASLLGVIIAIPWVNLYLHGTFFTSAHAHLALFGTLGMLVLGGAFYILSKGLELTPKKYAAGIIAVLLLNIGLIIMGAGLMIAGFLQGFLWRFLGMEFMQVELLLKPYLIIRALGGSIFTAGDLMLAGLIFISWRNTKSI